MQVQVNKPTTYTITKLQLFRTSEGELGFSRSKSLIKRINKKLCKRANLLLTFYYTRDELVVVEIEVVVVEVIIIIIIVVVVVVVVVVLVLVVVVVVVVVVKVVVRNLTRERSALSWKKN